MEFPNLELRITGSYAEGPPNRQLQLPCVIRNPETYAICIVNSWIRVAMQGQALVAEGNLLKMSYALVERAFIAPSSDALGKIVFDLRPNVLAHIESVRAGQDLELSFTSELLVFKINIQGQTATAAEPRQTSFNTRAGALKYRIPRSDWVNLLSTMGWTELELLEIPSSLTTGKPTVARAVARFKDAQESFRSGKWGDTLINSRKVFEALIKDTLGVDSPKQGEEALKILVKHDEKAACFNKVIHELADFLALGRHEKQPAVAIDRIDAEVALRVTGALLNYIAAA